MLKSYITIALRNFKRNRLQSIINLSGLSIGFALTIIMAFYIAHEYSFDKFHTHYSRIYRLTNEIKMSGNEPFYGSFTSGMLAPALSTEVPGIEAISRLWENEQDFWYADKHIGLSDGFSVDSTFLKIMSFKMLQGDSTKALNRPFTIVLTQSLAQRIFGNINPMGKTILANEQSMTVTGIIEDVPASSHLQFSFLTSIESYIRADYDIVKNNGISFGTYFLTKKDYPFQNIEERLITICDTLNSQRFSSMGAEIVTGIQPLHAVYLHSGLGYEIGLTGDLQKLYIVGILALVILALAIINFINLVTAQAEKRTREIGIRKVMGAVRHQLFKQFIIEAEVTTLLAFILSLLLIELLTPQISLALGTSLPIIYHKHPTILLFLFLLSLVIGFMAGTYPALYLSKFSPLKVMKGSSIKGRNAQPIRKILVLFQFATATTLMIALIVLRSQTHYMTHRSMGFDKENLLVVNDITKTIRTKWATVKAELSQLPGVINITTAQHIPGSFTNMQNCYRTGSNPNSGIVISELRTGCNYINTFNINLISGHDFWPGQSTDSMSFILNERAVELLKLTNPIGEHITVYNIKGPVIGIVQNFHFKEMQQKIAPMVLTMYSDYFSRIIIRLREDKQNETRAQIEQIIEHTDPTYLVNTNYLNQTIKHLYASEKRTSIIMSWGTLLAFFISMLGLFALTVNSTQLRTKEIGIRKSLGATRLQIIHLLLKDTGRWVLLSNIIAWPISWYIMDQWLNQYAYHIAMHLWMPLLAAIVAMSVALLTVYWQSFRAATANPIRALRYQ